MLCTKKKKKKPPPLHEWQEEVLQSEVQQQPPEITTSIFDEGSFCPTAKLVGNKSYSIVTNYLGTPVQAYDETGRLKWETELDIYGKVRTFEGDKALIPFRYQGQYEDEETGLYYNRFRYYSPEEGIYLSQDPIGLAGGDRLYSYVHDPNGWIDELGLVSGLSDKSRELYRHGKTREALDVHYEDQVRARTGGQSMDINGREYDAVTKNKIIQAKRSMTAVENPKNFLSKSTRTQIKKTIELAKAQGKSAEYWFKYGVHPTVRKYIESKGGKVVTGLGSDLSKCR